MAAEVAAKQAIDVGMREVEVCVKGPGAGREAAIRALQAAGLEVSLIKDVTPVPQDVYKRQGQGECLPFYKGGYSCEG